MSRLSAYIKLARLNQPIGIWLLFLPCLCGIFLSLKEISNPELAEIFRIIFLFFVGSVSIRSAGCVVNDIFDQKFDEKVTRSKSRPLAAKIIKRSEALILLSILLIVGFIILLQFNMQTIVGGFFALSLVITYPLMKRITYYPQVFLGLTFNFGILMSSLATLQTITSSSIIFYLSLAIWTVIYDTIYAHQDVNDDIRIGVKSTAIKFGKNTKKILISLSLVMFLGLVFLGWKESFGPEFFLTILLADMFLNHKIQKCNLENPADCLKFFKSNIWFGILILIAVILG